VSGGFTAADRLVLLWARGLTITLTESGQLDVQGPPTVIHAAVPVLKKFKPEIVAELKRIQETMS